jgi:hypothetical protein
VYTVVTDLAVLEIILATDGLNGSGV